MLRQEYKDRNGRLLGWRDQSGWKINGYDANGQLRGWYEAGDDRTRDANGMIVGTGDLLSSLITSRL